MTPDVQRQSTLFGFPVKTPPKDAEAASHALLVQGGFVRQLASGIFSLLPLGLRVHRRIEEIIREEMVALGAQEVLLPVLQPRALWEESGRWKTHEPPLFTVTDRHGKAFALGPTHEEVITDLARTIITSWRQLPISVFQIQTKFRNEQRPTGGLLRVREFVMKDLYSFHETEDDLRRFYEDVKRAYVRVFGRCGLTVVPVEAATGSIGGDASHEFALIAETGEDAVAQCPACGFAANVEVIGADARACPRCRAALTIRSCIESGHIFQLGMTYSRAMGATFTTAKGARRPLAMGCYGIGVGRLLAAIVEASHDERGILWPASVAPFDVHVLSVRSAPAARDLSRDLAHRGLRILLDDRDAASPGESFADSERIGVPVQVIVSERGQRDGTVEVRPRADRTNTRRLARTNIHTLTTHIQTLLNDPHAR